MHVYLVMAMTADGKSATVDREAPHFGEADRLRLEALCARADALVMGAGTLRSYGDTLRVKSEDLKAQRKAAGQDEQPLTVVVSSSGEFDTDINWFERPGDRAIATTEASADALGDTYEGLAEVWPCGIGKVDVAAVIHHLQKRGAEEIALLGGANLNATFFDAGVVDTLELTLAPHLYGGKKAPTIIDGEGLDPILDLELSAVRRADDMLFLTYRVTK